MDLFGYEVENAKKKFSIVVTPSAQMRLEEQSMIIIAIENNFYKVS